MSDKTGIQWTDATWNPVRGCRRVSAGCEHCYAEVVAARFSGEGQAYYQLARRRSNGEAQWTGETKFVERHLKDPIRWKEPKRIFVNSMSDLFYEGFSDDEVAQVVAVMALAPHHTFQVLTKRPARMQALMSDKEFRELVNTYIGEFAVAWSDPLKRRTDDLRATAPELDDDNWPLANVWLGVSTENQAMADERIPLLLDTPAAVRFISAEPLLGPIDLTLYLEEEGYIDDRYVRPLDWVIVGGESGPHARSCDVAWVERIVADCGLEGVACFVKQLGRRPVAANDDAGSWPGEMMPLAESYQPHHQGEVAPLELSHSHGGDMSEWPDYLKVRAFPFEVTRGR